MALLHVTFRYSIAVEEVRDSEYRFLNPEVLRSENNDVLVLSNANAVAGKRAIAEIRTRGARFVTVLGILCIPNEEGFSAVRLDGRVARYAASAQPDGGKTRLN
jgi:hypothetical protein